MSKIVGKAAWDIFKCKKNLHNLISYNSLPSKISSTLIDSISVMARSQAFLEVLIGHYLLLAFASCILMPCLARWSLGFSKFIICGAGQIRLCCVQSKKDLQGFFSGIQEETAKTGSI